jgi:hypothetical protein
MTKKKDAKPLAPNKSEQTKDTVVAEWVRHAESNVSDYRHVVAKPLGGRPEGGVTRAARELSVRGKILCFANYPRAVYRLASRGSLGCQFGSR